MRGLGHGGGLYAHRPGAIHGAVDYYLFLVVDVVHPRGGRAGRIARIQHPGIVDGAIWSLQFQIQVIDQLFEGRQAPRRVVPGQAGPQFTRAATYGDGILVYLTMSGDRLLAEIPGHDGIHSSHTINPTVAELVVGAGIAQVYRCMHQ